ncbi:glycosyltransferase involved in cell wall biosynthesis [Dysgonomonadaceae bacterium PH5-43]|nr:glycosyltransferase involved in cell wall biosynthesis [Dysgonomonadaceae bacterium PH5-43]
MIDNEKIKVSICVITYNQEKYIEECIDSLLRQQADFDFEIVIGDDSSTDNTSKICKEYQLKYPEIIRYHYNETNLGILNNFTNTLLRARGEYLAICAGDDYWIDDYKLQKQVYFLENNPEYSLCCTNWKNYYEENNIIESDRASCEIKGNLQDYFISRNIEKILLENMPGLKPSTFCFRKNIFIKEYEKDKFLFTNLKFPSEDLQLVLLLIDNGKFHFINEDMLVYRVVVSSASNSNNAKKRATLALGVFSIKLYLLRRYGLSQKTQDIMCRNALGGLLPYAYKEHDAGFVNEICEVLKDYSYNLRMSHRLLILGSRNVFFYWLLKPLFIITEIYNIWKKCIKNN